MKIRSFTLLATVLSAAIVALSFNQTSAADTPYECWTYRNGKPIKMTKVPAKDEDDAVSKAKKKFKRLGVSWDYIKCHP